MSQLSSAHASVLFFQFKYVHSSYSVRLDIYLESLIAVKEPSRLCWCCSVSIQHDPI